MYASATMAILHHVAAFTLVAALAVEVALFKPPLSPVQARRLLRTDFIFGAAATVVLVVGMLRVAFFEKGREYYWHDLYFLIKFGAFIAAALISIYPTLTFLSWSRGLKAGVAPGVPEARTRRVRLCRVLEPRAVPGLLACVALVGRRFV